MARFLVVDDDHSTVQGMTLLLNADGHDVAPHTAGAAAVEALAQGTFDAVLTDFEMPEVDGAAVVRAARQQCPTACVVVVTTRDNMSSRLVDQGACMVVGKPMDYEGVTNAIVECREGRAQGGDGRCRLKACTDELTRLQHHK
jgi:CheY-like chemotaxis protein